MPHYYLLRHGIGSADTELLYTLERRANSLLRQDLSGSQLYR